MMLPVKDALTTSSSPLEEGEQGQDQLGGVAEGRVQEPADAGTEPVGQLFGRLAHQAGQRDDRHARRDELGRPVWL